MILAEIDYLEFQLTVNPVFPFSSRAELDRFIAKWRHAREPAFQFFLTVPDFHDKIALRWSAKG